MRRLLLTLCLALAAQARGQASFDCEASPEHRQFDFWLGSWEVTDKAGETRYGANRISKRDAGCLLLEEYTGARGFTGSSVNYYNPSDKQWHQHWIDNGTSIIQTAGGMRDGSMYMEGTIYYLATAKTSGFRGTWTPLEDGRVRQFFEEKNAEGVWETWFDGYYSRTD